MPLIPLTERDTFTETPEVPDLSPQSPPETTEVPRDRIGQAALRQSGWIGSIGSDQRLQHSKRVDPEFNLYSELEGTEYEQDIEKFIDVHNKEDLELTNQFIARQRED